MTAKTFADFHDCQRDEQQRAVGKLTVECTGFRPMRKNSLCGFAMVHIVEMRMTIRDIAIHQRGEARWAQVPAKPLLDQNDNPVRDRTTRKIQYVTIIDFDSKVVRDAFSAAVTRAVLKFEPGAFAGAEAGAHA